MSVIGQCRLCLRTDSELQDSHFLSKGIYRILRDAGAKNPDPFLITAGSSVQTSKQLKKHLLCKQCEGRLSGGGERWVLANCRRSDGPSPLRACWHPGPPTWRAQEIPARFTTHRAFPGFGSRTLRTLRRASIGEDRFTPGMRTARRRLNSARSRKSFASFSWGRQGFLSTAVYGSSCARARARIG